MMFSFSYLLYQHNALAFGATLCVAIVQQRNSHFYAKPHHSVKVVKQNRVKSIIVLYNSVIATFSKIDSLLVQLVQPKISMNNYLNVMNREDIILHRNFIMLTIDFERQNYTYLRCLVFMKKVVCTYGNKKRNSNHE